VSFHKSRFAPTEVARLAPWPPHLTEAPDLRPVDHPGWEEFRAAMAAAGFGLHITASAEQFARQDGPKFWRLWLTAKEAPCPTTTLTLTST
jgi:hypothetical protein